MNRMSTLGRRLSRPLIALWALAGLVVLIVYTSGPAEILFRVTGVPEDDGTWSMLHDTVQGLTEEALVPTIVVAPLAAVAGGLALLVGGGGRQGSGGIKLIAGAFGAVIVVVFARVFAK